VTVVGLRSDRRGRVAASTAAMTRGGRWPSMPPMVVGADGLRSTVARHVGAPLLRTGRGASAVVYGYWAGVDADGYQWIFRPEACAGLIPTNDGLTCVFAAASPARIGRGGPAVLDAVLEQASPASCRARASGYARRPVSAPSRDTQAWCGRRGGRGGPSSAMPGTGRIPSAPTV
jgi:2-polyprenyl-6-methoxyphenol hydroxylase-like FAD-dependent oxidoreductase